MTHPFDETPGFPELRTQRLLLRGLTEGDQYFLAALDSDPRVMRFIHHGAVLYDEALRYANTQIELARYRRHSGRWVVELDSQRAGWVELSKLSGRDQDDL